MVGKEINPEKNRYLKGTKAFRARNIFLIGGLLYTVAGYAYFM
jgi:hypothetical protein